jgi:hypothetical protein
MLQFELSIEDQFMLRSHELMLQSTTHADLKLLYMSLLRLHLTHKQASKTLLHHKLTGDSTHA